MLLPEAIAVGKRSGDEHVGADLPGAGPGEHAQARSQRRGTRIAEGIRAEEDTVEGEVAGGEHVAQGEPPDGEQPHEGDDDERDDAVPDQRHEEDAGMRWQQLGHDPRAGPAAQEALRQQEPRDRPHDHERDLVSEQEGESEKQAWLESYREKTEAVLRAYREMLIAAGFAPEAVTMHAPRRYCPSMAECILSERDTRAYATIVVGRQGLSRKEEFLFGSISNKIVSHARDCSVWVVA